MDYALLPDQKPVGCPLACDDLLRRLRNDRRTMAIAVQNAVRLRTAAAEAGARARSLQRDNRALRARVAARKGEN